MLSQLKIKNFALIDDLQIEFAKGLSVITGETGAGKSILLGALRLILGERADYSSLGNPDLKCIIEANFSIKDYHLETFFKSNELDYWEESILRREVLPQGKSRAFINDTPVTLDVMRSLGEQLVDLHSQHQSLQINQPAFQLLIVDAVAGIERLREEFKVNYNSWKKRKQQLKELEDKALEAQRDQDYWEFQFNELVELNYQEGEEDSLTEEQEILSNSEQLIQNYQMLQALMKEGETNILDQLKQANNILADNAKFLSKLEPLKERFQSSLIDLDDIMQELERQFDDFEFEPQRLEYINSRLAEILRLSQKHQLDSADELIDIQNQLDDKLNAQATYQREIDDLRKEVEAKEKDLREKAESLHQARRKVIPKIEKSVNQTLKDLGIANARLKVDQTLDHELSESGLDRFEFLFTANQGKEPQKLANTASGGEISRLVLSLKSLLAERKALPTILFDEIDTGVSGEVADRMGDLLNQMSQQRQLISITHLPQIAAKGQHHYFVYKENVGGSTQSRIKKLEAESRVEELAKMLSGKTTTEAAMNNARELLAH